MGKKDEKTLLFRDYFGLYKDYYLFLIRTKYGFYRFGALISQLCESPVSYIGNVNTENLDGNPVFRMLYTLASEQDQTEIFLIENKTIEHQTTIPSVNAHSGLSLFDEIPYYYIVNKTPPAIVQGQFVDYDFLVLISKDMNYAATDTLTLFKQPAQFESYEITALLDATTLKSKKGQKNAEFIQHLFQTSSIKVTEFQEEREVKILGRTEIPDANWNSKHKFPPRNPDSEHVKLLLVDSSFE
ncbi:MAG: hypothetical protein LBV02_06460 [Bacteroidales bacterium]|nr:hypothetical protein [Bacteroidales bacterium]